MKHLVARVGRVLLWVTVGLVFLIGVIDIATPSTAGTAGAVRPPQAGWPDDLARAYACEFAQAYLTWDPKHPDGYQQRVARYLPSDTGTPTLPVNGKAQTVQEAHVTSVKPAGPDRALITVAALVNPGGWRYLVVPVARDPHGLVVFDDPAFAAPPGHAAQDSTEPDTLEDPGAQEIEFVTAQFLHAYLAGDPAGVSAWTLPSVRITPLVTPLTLIGSPTVGQEGETFPRSRTVLADVDARDGSGAVYSLRYRVALRRGDRWYVASVNEGSR